MPAPIAIVRNPGPDFIRAISDHPQKHRIDFKRAQAQHACYMKALQQAGARVVALEPLDDFPDSPFVEDTAVIFDREALICRMKAESRRGEVESVAEAVGQYRTLVRLEPPATLDGGDVLKTEGAVFVGQSTRTNREALEALAECSGKPCVPVPVHRGLHLKSSVSFLGENLLVLDPSSVETSALKKFEWIEVNEGDRYAANCLTLGKCVLMPAGFPKVSEKIRDHGFQVIELEMSEFEKADGGVTCLSLIIKN